MNKRLKSISCVLAATLSLVALENTVRFGPIGVDVVSAATGDAAPVTGTPTKTSTSSSTSYTSGNVSRILALGSAGNDVKAIQTALNTKGNNLKVDGFFGNLTLDAVKNFQKANALVVDGIVGPNTLVALIPSSAVPTSTIKVGSTGNDVKYLQTNLNKLGYKLTVDGIFGNLTLNAVKGFQKDNSLAVDGITGPNTFGKLFEKTTAPAAPTTPTVPATPTVPTTPVTPVDTVTSASVVNNNDAFKKAIGTKDKGGNWIIATLNDLTVNEPLVVDGQFMNEKNAIQRKIALYTQDDKRNVTARFTLTAPKITILSPNASIEQGTFVGDVYISASGFQLKGATVNGNIYFTNKSAADTFKMDAASKVTGKQETKLSPELVDAVTSASLVNNSTDFQKAISKDGKWIIAVYNNLTLTNDITLDGNFVNTKTPPVSSRKLALYSQDDKHATTARFVLTAPKLNVNSPDANITKGMFKGDVYVNSKNFQLIDAAVDGNIYFTTQEAKDTFKQDVTSVVTGQQILAQVDAVTSASIVDNTAAFKNAISSKGTWIIPVLRDLTSTEDLVLEGIFNNTKVPPVQQRKIALYSQDDKHVVTRRFTLTAPKLTINSPSASIQHGIFKGNLYVSADNFQLVDQKVIGNVYFTTQSAKDTFKMDATSSVSGVQQLVTK